jgi:MFS family permease
LIDSVVRDRPGYGWVIVAVLFFAQMLVIGSTAFGFGVLVKPIAAEYGFSRADANMGLVLLLLGMAIISPFIGRALDRIAGRIVVVGGALAFGIGCAVVASTTSLWGMTVAVFVLVATGMAALGPLTGSTLTARWFDRGRGRALGVISMSSSVGGLVMLPCLAFLVERFGWRIAVFSVGVTIAVLVAGIGLIAICEPPAVRQKIPPRAAASSILAVDQEKNWSVGRLLRTRDFWLLTFSVGALLAVDQALLASIISYGTDNGFSLQAATVLVSAVSASSIAGKLLIGVIVDVLDRRWILLAVAALNAIFLGVLVLQPSYGLLLTGCLVAGAAVGGTLPLWASFVGARFGVLSYGTVMGLMIPLQMPLNLLGLRYVGYSYDVTRSYQSAFLTFIVVVALAALAILPVKPSVNAE